MIMSPTARDDAVAAAWLNSQQIAERVSQGVIYDAHAIYLERATAYLRDEIGINR
jgi:hypothetical protein